MSSSCREALPDVQEWSEGPQECPRVVGRPARMSGSGREVLTDVPHGYPGVVGRSSLMSGSGLEVLPDVWEWSGGPLECLRVVGRPSRMSGSGREALSHFR